MTSECPQCKFPIPRYGSRFCNECGAEIRAVSARLFNPDGGSGEPGEGRTAEIVGGENEPRLGETIERLNKGVISVGSQFNDQPIKTDMAASQDDAKPQKPDATIHILLRDGTVIERDLDNDETRIGKGPHNEIILADASVSGSHAMISFSNGGYALSDLGSRNGTFLNDSRVTEQRQLQHGDLIKMGHCTITFRLKEAGDTLSMPRTQLLDAMPPPPPTPPPAPKPAAITEDALASELVSSGLVAQSEIDRLQSGGAKGRRLCRALIEEKLVTEIGLRDLMSRTFNILPVELKTMDVDSSAATTLRPQFLRDRLACPVIGQAADRVLLAIADPTDKATIDDVERITRKKTSLRLAMPTEIIAQLDNHFTPRLIGVLPSGEKIEALLNHDELEIGKAQHNRLVISDPTVSSTHAIVLARDGGYSVADLGSSNGTFVNDRRLGSEAHTLQHGDKIQLGQVILAFRNPAETTENKTARLSLEALEEVRRRAATRAVAPSGHRTDPSSWNTLPAAVIPSPAQAAQSLEDEAERKEKKKKEKKKDDDRIKAALVNSTSRILSTVLGAALTVALAYYITRPTQPAGGGSSSGSSTSSGGASATTSGGFAAPGSWKSFSSGLSGLFGAAVEASGAIFAPGSNGVFFVSDNKKSEALWMQLDQDGKQVGSIKPVALGVNFKDPEAITYGNSYFYLVTSQGDPKDGDQNAIVRFDINTETQTLRGPAEIILDFRSFLLSNVTEISTLGAPSGMQGGLNIEGMAWDPNHERLLLGLRSPQIGAQAVLIPLKLKDPRGAFNLENLKIDDPRVIVLPLDGHGVRDITYDTHLKNFLIISGAPETSPKTDFILWEWNGRPDSKPLKVLTLDDKMKPEGITSVTINGRNFVFIVGDAGSYLTLNYADAK